MTVVDCRRVQNEVTKGGEEDRLIPGVQCLQNLGSDWSSHDMFRLEERTAPAHDAGHRTALHIQDCHKE